MYSFTDETTTYNYHSIVLTCTGITINCLSNALHSSIGQNIKSLACPVSDDRSPISGQSAKNFKWP